MKSIKLFKGNKIKKCLLFCGVGSFIAACAPATDVAEAESKVKPLVAYVNLFMGTSGDHGQLSPAGSLPFGMVKLGPETDPTNHSGYNYDATKIKGFSHNRIEGVGCVGSGGNILIKPGVGPLDTLAVSYQKESEKASPGYYEVQLGDSTNPIKVELTVTNATGWHKYTFPNASQNWLMIDLGASHELFLSEKHELNGKKELSGSVSANTVCRQDGGAYQFYYNLVIDHEVEEVVEQGKLVFLRFANAANNDREVNLKVSLSTISPEQAKKDRVVEVGNRSFEDIKSAAAEKWEEKLSKIKVTGNEEYKGLFYSNLYRSFLSPCNITSTDGTYRGSDGKVYEADGFTYYHGWSIWDTFRTKMPLLTLIDAETMLDFCQSLVALYKQGKHNWASTTEPFPTVRTEHAAVVLLDAYRKGIIDFDLRGVYPYLIQELDSLPYQSPDNILESSYDYWAVSEIAGLLGNTEDQKKHLQKANEFEKIYKAKFQTMDDQSDIMHGDGLYEGTLWQYRWFVPWNIPKMKALIGGEESFRKQLDQFFENNLYNHGNQPDIQAPFLYNYTDQPWKSQKLVNQILTKDMEQWYGTHKKWEGPYKGRIYKNQPEGYLKEMDDDAGTMSSWFVLAAVGLYPANVGEPLWLLSSPIFKQASLQVEKGKSFNIEATNFSDSTFYIDNFTLNGQKRTGFEIRHQFILSGGLLKLE